MSIHKRNEGGTPLQNKSQPIYQERSESPVYLNMTEVNISKI